MRLESSVGLNSEERFRVSEMWLDKPRLATHSGYMPYEAAQALYERKRALAAAQHALGIEIVSPVSPCP